MLQNVDDTGDDLEELLLDARFSSISAALQVVQVVSLLDSVVAKGALEPLDQVEDASRVIAQVDRKVEQVKASGSTQAAHQASLNAFCQLLRVHGGLKASKHREGN